MSRTISEATKQRMLDATNRFQETVLELRQELEDEINELEGGGFGVVLEYEVGVIEKTAGMESVLSGATKTRTNVDQPFEQDAALVSLLAGILGNTGAVH